jgi:hypothetical protein
LSLAQRVICVVSGAGADEEAFHGNSHDARVLEIERASYFITSQFPHLTSHKTLLHAQQEPLSDSGKSLAAPTLAFDERTILAATVFGQRLMPSFCFSLRRKILCASPNLMNECLGVRGKAVSLVTLRANIRAAITKYGVNTKSF